MIKRKFFNEELGIELTSYIDNKQNVWFRGNDVARILGYSVTDQAIRKHVSDNHKQLICCPVELKGQQNDMRSKWTMFIDEAGFYELVFSSKLKAAKKFRDWVFTTVLPSIRKYGYYKLFKIENETRGKQRILIGGKKYSKHPVLSNYAASKNGDIISLKTKRIMRMADNGVGYLCFVICDKKLEKPKTHLQHRFIYEVFKGAIPRFFQIDHINNCKKDNRLKNLQLLTPVKNNQKSNNKAIISINMKTCEKKKYVSLTKAAIELGICISYISQICNKRKHYISATSKKDCKKYTFEYLH